MQKAKKTTKKFSLNDFKANAKTIASKKALASITGGLEDACHPSFSRMHWSTGGSY